MIHDSDCSTNSAPALPVGQCDCDAGRYDALSRMRALSLRDALDKAHSQITSYDRSMISATEALAILEHIRVAALAHEPKSVRDRFIDAIVPLSWSERHVENIFDAIDHAGLRVVEK